MSVLEVLWAREQIRDLLSRYCDGIDRRDWNLVRSCFGDDHVHSHEHFEGNLDEFIEYVRGFLSEVAVSHHSITNAKIEISEDGKSAHCEANFISINKIEEGKLPKLSFPSEGHGADWTVAGRYIDDFECRDGTWKIVKRQALSLIHI